MKRLILTLALILFLMPVGADAAKRILNLQDEQVPLKVDRSAFTTRQVQSMIMESCIAKGWTPAIKRKGVISASITIRGKHYAEVEIPFTANSYSILYVSSENLDYNEERQSIHRNYNNWVLNLAASIDRTLRLARRD